MHDCRTFFFEPFMFEFSPLIFCAFSNASAEVRDSARIAQASIASSLHNNTITFITPALVQGLTHKKLAKQSSFFGIHG